MSTPYQTDIPITRTSEGRGPGPLSRVRWGAVLAGLVVTLALQFVLYLVGLGTGLAAYDVGDSGKAFGIGTAIWALLVPLVALFVGGMTTGRLAGVLTPKDGFLHGVLTWSLATLVGLWLLTNGIGAIAGNTLRLAGNVVGGAASAATQVASTAVSSARGNGNNGGGGLDLASVRREVDEALRQTGNPSLNPDSLRADASQAANATTGGASNEQLADEIGAMFRDRAGDVRRDDLINVIAARTQLSRAEAERLADRMQGLGQQARGQLQQVQESAGEVVDQGATAAASGIWLALLALGLSLGAAVFGTLRTARE